MDNTCNIMDCDVYQAIQKIKSRYTSVFVYSLAANDKKFAELEAEFDFISATQVSRTLKQLIRDQIAICDANTYKLTTLGHELVNILDALETWNEKIEKQIKGE